LSKDGAWTGYGQPKGTPNRQWVARDETAESLIPNQRVTLILQVPYTSYGHAAGPVWMQQSLRATLPVNGN